MAAAAISWRIPHSCVRPPRSSHLDPTLVGNTGRATFKPKARAPGRALAAVASTSATTTPGDDSQAATARSPGHRPPRSRRESLCCVASPGIRLTTAGLSDHIDGRGRPSFCSETTGYSQSVSVRSPHPRRDRIVEDAAHDGGKPRRSREYRARSSNPGCATPPSESVRPRDGVRVEQYPTEGRNTRSTETSFLTESIRVWPKSSGLPAKPYDPRFSASDGAFILYLPAIVTRVVGRIRANPPRLPSPHTKTPRSRMSTDV